VFSWNSSYTVVEVFGVYVHVFGEEQLQRAGMLGAYAAVHGDGTRRRSRRKPRYTSDIV
jgi:hypothetical protein